MMQSSRRQRTYDVVVTRKVLGIRQKPQRRKRRRPRQIPWGRLLSLPVLIGLIAVTYQLSTAPAYTIERAVVSGNTLIDAETIFQVSGVQGRNLFLVNTRAASEAIERLPYVKRAVVRTAMPAQVSIVVQEYRPRWVWLAGRNRFWIDETGEVLPDNDTLDEALTVIDPSSRALPVGSKLAPHLVEMLDMINLLIPDLKHVTYEEGVGFIMTVGPGWPARIGDDPDRLAEIVGILNVLLPKLVQDGKDIDLIDLRYPERPYYREKEQSLF